MKNSISQDTTPPDYTGYRTIRYKLKVIFACLTAIPFFVFGFIFVRIGTFSTALSASLISLSLILVLQGFIVFRRMADHIEQLSSTMARAEQGDLEKIQDVREETRELAMIADTFNRTLSKLENTARELGVRAIQASTLYEIREIVSTSINLEELGKVILERTMKAANSQAGYIGVKKDDPPTLHVAATSGITENIPEKIDLDETRTLAGLVINRKTTVLIKDIEQEPNLKNLNIPDIGLPCLLCLPIVTKGTSIGLLVLGRDNSQPHFEEEDIQFLQTLLHQVAYSVENARLYENLQQSNRELENALESQRKAQDQLLDSARMAAFGELSVNIAHELNNPLTGILGYTDLILDSSVDTKKTKELLEKIRGQAVRAGNITKSLLDYLSVKPGSKIKTDLNGLVNKTILLVRGKMAENSIDLDLRLAEKLPPVMVDPTQIGQVFFELITNALKAMTGAFRMPSGSDQKDLKTQESRRLIRIESGGKDNTVYVSFKDTGSGMLPEHQSRIFEPFFSTQDKVSQVGLGLWVCHRIATAYGGSIRVKSAPGRGSIFVVVLPSAGKNGIE